MSRIREVIDLSTEQPIGTMAIGSAADAQKAIAAARNAFVSFSQTTKEERLALLKRTLAILNEAATAATMISVRRNSVVAPDGW
ncbi:aldehyde dehydrogenase family protein [Sinorhizobium numidicum]|uniref:aldehyde dehydrogenase family protein n=1 Tax=Sinorhizobium numidicum TaxID=680248 RepID=UPI003CC8B7C6